MTNQLCYFCCFLGAQGSGKVQHCDCGRVITKGLRQGAFTEGCHPWRTIVITLQCPCSDHLLSLSNQNKQNWLHFPALKSFGHSLMLLSHTPISWLPLNPFCCQHLFRRQNNFPLFYAGKFSSLFPVQTANSAVGLPLLSKDLDKAPKWLFARSSINLTEPDTLHKCVGENRKVSFLHL